MPDHIHIFIGMKPACCMNDLMREVIKSSNTFIKENELSQVPFSRQDGFGAFSYSLSHINSVYK
jgi:REP element-mobilizing transposase RayT